MSDSWKLVGTIHSLFVVPASPRVPDGLVLVTRRRSPRLPQPSWLEDMVGRARGEADVFERLARDEVPMLNDLEQSPVLNERYWSMPSHYIGAIRPFSLPCSESAALYIYSHMRARLGNSCPGWDDAADASQALWDNGRWMGFEYDRDMPTLTDVRALLNKHANLVDADALLSNVLRRRCGLGETTARGWVIAYILEWLPARGVV